MKQNMSLLDLSSSAVGLNLLDEYPDEIKEIIIEKIKSKIQGNMISDIVKELFNSMSKAQLCQVENAVNKESRKHHIHCNHSPVNFDFKLIKETTYFMDQCEDCGVYYEVGCECEESIEYQHVNLLMNGNLFDKFKANIITFCDTDFSTRMLTYRHKYIQRVDIVIKINKTDYVFKCNTEDEFYTFPNGKFISGMDMMDYASSDTLLNKLRKKGIKSIILEASRLEHQYYGVSVSIVDKFNNIVKLETNIDYNFDTNESSKKEQLIINGKKCNMYKREFTHLG